MICPVYQISRTLDCQKSGHASNIPDSNTPSGASWKAVDIVMAELTCSSGRPLQSAAGNRTPIDSLSLNGKSVMSGLFVVVGSRRALLSLFFAPYLRDLAHLWTGAPSAELAWERTQETQSVRRCRERFWTLDQCSLFTLLNIPSHVHH